MKTYRVYGLVIDSEIELPELVQSENEKPDVRIRIGKVPESLNHPEGEGIFFQAVKDGFLFKIKGIVSFWVQNGSSITLHPHENSTPEEIRLFLLGSALGALLHQRDILAIHGSAIATEKGALIITGCSSSGKSSLAAALLKRGYKFVADDISALHRHGNRFILHHGIPHLRLWKDVMEDLHINYELERIRVSIEKYRKPVLDDLIDTPQIPKKIVVLSTKNTEGFIIRELFGIQKFESLRSNTYRYQFINGLQKSHSHFNAISDLANSVQVYQIQRPSSPLLINELSELVISNVIDDPK